MTETMKPKEIYFDDLVKGNILSFLPSLNDFKLGTFYNRIKNFCNGNGVILFSDSISFIKKDKEGQYISFVLNNILKPNEKLLGMNTRFFNNSNVFRPTYLITHNNCH